VFSLVGDPLSGNGCGSPNHIVLIIFSLVVLFTQFIVDKIKKAVLYQVKQLNHILLK